MNPDGEVHTPPKLVNEIYKLFHNYLIGLRPL